MPTLYTSSPLLVQGLGFKVFSPQSLISVSEFGGGGGVHQVRHTIRSTAKCTLVSVVHGVYSILLGLAKASRSEMFCMFVVDRHLFLRVHADHGESYVFIGG